MAATTVSFEDGSAYERFMGRWSRAIGHQFLRWLEPKPGMSWLEIGCGTGVFTEVLLDAVAPASLIAVDPAVAQIDYARQRLASRAADIRIADARNLPFSQGEFDFIVSALALNFIPEIERAAGEMRRVCRPGGWVAGYVWDFAGDRSSGWPLRSGFRKIGIEPPQVPGADVTSMEALKRLFAQAGLEQVEVRSLEVRAEFANFDEYWRSQTPAFTPQGKAVSELAPPQRDALIDAVRAALPTNSDGGVFYSAHANAIKSRCPE
jgi:ubiquinone/menaquinone biosynthesis C-methylase UbiE